MSPADRAAIAAKLRDLADALEWSEDFEGMAQDAYIAAFEIRVRSIPPKRSNRNNPFDDNPTDKPAFADVAT